jgi:hypothetical protein
MDYLTHFITDESEGRTGRFTMIVSADNLDEARNKYKAAILLQRELLFEDTDKIYLEEIIQINRVPEVALILKYESTTSDGGGIAINPIEDDNPDIDIWVTDDPESEEPGGLREWEPFIDFLAEAQKRR